MKKICYLTFLLFLSINYCNSQESLSIRNVRFKIGGLVSFTGGGQISPPIWVNDLMNSEISDFFDEEYHPPFNYGINFEISMPTKLNQINLTTGVILFGLGYGPIKDDLDDWIIDETSYGGGVYLGPDLKIGNKRVGFLSTIGIGYLNFSRKYIITNLLSNTEEYYKEYSNGLGGIGNVGLYLSLGSITIAPAYFVIITGSKEGSSFLHNGLSLQLIIQSK